MEKAILLGINTSTKSSVFLEEMEELKSLCKACEIEVIETFVQNASTPHPSTYFGKGKLEEIAEYLESNEQYTLVFNDELTPAQVRNVEKVTNATIYDRTYVILEIFRRRARTKEARLQVEIASLQYLLPRVDGLRDGFSRQGGGDGGFYNRGSGETQLELDRRIIRNRISVCKQELSDLTKLRKQQRMLRKKNDLKVVSLVGYTNSGKSSTLNALLEMANQTKKDVFEKDMVFATLETATRVLSFTDFEFLITDTVGFVRKLPHQLIEAFRSTLEEITESDLIIHVVDASNPEFEIQIETTNQVLAEIGVQSIPMIYAFNKIDRLEDYFFIPSKYTDALRISAKSKHNLSILLEMVKKQLFSDYIYIHILLPYDQTNLLYRLKEQQAIEDISYLDHGMEIKAKISPRVYSTYAKYQLNNHNS